MKTSFIKFDSMAGYFDFFKDIPEEKWCTGDFVNDCGLMCALGLLGERATSLQTHPFRSKLDILGHEAATINNGIYGFSNELGDTPKERILNAIVLKESGILEDV